MLTIVYECKTNQDPGTYGYPVMIIMCKPLMMGRDGRQNMWGVILLKGALVGNYTHSCTVYL
jgi:hypothetical protein